VDGDAVTSILPEQTATENQSGGVQNWRLYEMNPEAVELPVIEEDGAVLWVTGGMTAGLFAAALLLRIGLYFKEVGEKPNVFKSK